MPSIRLGASDFDVQERHRIDPEMQYLATLHGGLQFVGIAAFQPLHAFNSAGMGGPAGNTVMLPPVATFRAMETGIVISKIRHQGQRPYTMLAAAFSSWAY